MATKPQIHTGAKIKYRTTGHVIEKIIPSIGIGQRGAVQCRKKAGCLNPPVVQEGKHRGLEAQMWQGHRVILVTK